MRIIPLTKEHLDRIQAQDAQEYVSAWITDQIKAELTQGMSFAAVEGDEVLCCAGILEYWEGRAAAWAVIAGNLGRRFIPIHRAAESFLKDSSYRRLEATADIGFCNGHRWLEMLGFKLETPVMKNYLPTGGDAAMYVRGI